MYFKKLFHYPSAVISQYYTTVVLVVGFLFLLAGSVLLLRIPYLFYQKCRLENGTQVPAKILWVERVGSKSGSTIYVKYEFKIHDQVYQGDRTSIFKEPRDLYFSLREARDSGREVICFVDPKNPRFSSLNIDIGVLDLFVSIVLGVPCALIGSHQLVGFFIAARRRSSQHELKQKNQKR